MTSCLRSTSPRTSSRSRARMGSSVVCLRMSRTSGAAAAQPWWIHTDEQFQVDVSQLAGDYREHNAKVLGLISCFLDLEMCAKETPFQLYITSLAQGHEDCERHRSGGRIQSVRSTEDPKPPDDQDHPGPPSIQSSPLKGPGVCLV